VYGLSSAAFSFLIKHEKGDRLFIKVLQIVLHKVLDLLFQTKRHMQSTLSKFMLLKALFCISAGIILFITGLAKVASAFGHAEILSQIDPIFGVSFKVLMLLIGCVEIVIAFFCLCLRTQKVSMVLVAWLSSSFLFYRLGLQFIGWHRPCHCLGNLTDALHIPPPTVDIVMKIVLTYLLLGSYANLFWSWKKKRKSGVEALSSAEGPKSIS
jgi:hypothetical protein